MKKLSTYLFLIFFSFSAPSWSNDIRDFEIEGMSIGDSALDYFTEAQLEDSEQDWFNYSCASMFYIEFIIMNNELEASRFAPCNPEKQTSPLENNLLILVCPLTSTTNPPHM